MKKMTEANLKAAFAGESQAHMKYLIFAQKAQEEGKPNVARLFEAISLAEQVHATNHLKALNEVGDTIENLQTAISGETFEVEEMYPAYDAVAKLQEEKSAQKSINYALSAEKVHAGLYSKAKQAVESGADVKIGKISVCKVCGWTIEGDAPERCPLCNAAKENFKTF
ncbi:MAG: rubrerythrin family protein [Candidatus Omnitrophica bacterium]|nr:rubrerythrin family protein [Candidatus Omnitrophota bacterium]MCM8821769.1 rubrerythrin family protein [Candidatus Omnitrophota bacterium]MCM8825066.1 rubrerythrin family protein [Candidatus Omnitrophota bacterium]